VLPFKQICIQPESITEEHWSALPSTTERNVDALPRRGAGGVDGRAICSALGERLGMTLTIVASAGSI